MAMRRPQQLLPLVPPQLLDPYRWASLEAWSDARFQWLLEHPDRTINGMDVVEIIYELDPMIN